MERVELEVPYAGSSKNFVISKKNLLAYIQHPLLKHPQQVEEENEILKGIQNPIGCERLKKLCDIIAQRLFLVDDWTRPTPAYKIIKFVIKELKRRKLRMKRFPLLLLGERIGSLRKVNC